MFDGQTRVEVMLADLSVLCRSESDGSTFFVCRILAPAVPHVGGLARVWRAVDRLLLRTNGLPPTKVISRYYVAESYMNAQNTYSVLEAAQPFLAKCLPNFLKPSQYDLIPS